MTELREPQFDPQETPSQPEQISDAKKRKIEIKKERMETKLYVARDVEGEPNREELKMIREIEKEFSTYPEFIGLAPFGSIVSGYKSELSDIDVYVLVDVSKLKKQADIESYRKVIFDINNRPSKRHISLHEVSINPEQIDVVGGFGLMADMTRVVIGKKIDEYRKMFADRLHELPQDEQENALEYILMTLTRSDDHSLVKRKGRMSEFSKQENKSILEQREKMWKKRIEKIWGVGGMEEVK